MSWLALNPAGLWALLALAVPIVIHLLSRTPGQRVPVGHIKLLEQARQKQARRPRIEQWILLVVRLLLLAVLAALLAELARPGLQTRSEDVVYYTPGVPEPVFANSSPAQDPLTISLSGAGTGAGADAWALLSEQLDLIDHRGTITVRHTGTLREFAERRPVLPAAINWEAAPGSSPAPAISPTVYILLESQHSGLRSSLEQALPLVREYRLPRLQWTLSTRTPDTSTLAGITRLVAFTQELPGVPANLDFILADAENWLDRSGEPDFIHWLTDQLLTDEQRRVAWSDLPVEPSAMPEFAAHDTALPWPPHRSLQPLLAVLLVGLWALERLLSERKKLT